MSRVLLSEMERRRTVVATRILLGFVVCLIWALVPRLARAQGTPLNETDLAAEADHCIIVYPVDMAVPAGTVSSQVFGALFENGLTEEMGPPPGVIVELGYGSENSNPWEGGWTWVPALYYRQSGSSDEFQASFTAPSSGGTYSYCFRFSFDGMVTATYADSDGAGSNPGLVFSPAKMGIMTVIGSGSCCSDRVGDANGLGGDEPTIGDASALIDSKFITGTCVGILDCLTEADINQSGGTDPDCDDITIGDISILIDYLYITGSSLGLPNCL